MLTDSMFVFKGNEDLLTWGLRWRLRWSCCRIEFDS